MFLQLRRDDKTQNWKVGDKAFKNVSTFKYLGNVIHKEGRINECVKDRIQVGNIAYEANHHRLKSKIIKRSAKTQIYKTLIRSVVTYGSETWTLTKSNDNFFRIFGRKILHRIYGPVQEGVIWRISNN